LAADAGIQRELGMMKGYQEKVIRKKLSGKSCQEKVESEHGAAIALGFGYARCYFWIVFVETITTGGAWWLV
jgi:hypothetical protein